MYVIRQKLWWSSVFIKIHNQKFDIIVVSKTRMSA